MLTLPPQPPHPTLLPNAALQSELGDVVYAEMPEVGASFSAGDRMAIVESVKVRTAGWLAGWGQQCWGPASV